MGEKIYEYLTFIMLQSITTSVEIIIR